MSEPVFHWARRGPDAPWEIVRIVAHPNLGRTWARPFDRAPVPAHWFQLGPRIDPPVARPASEYHEDMGAVLWWRMPVQEPPYIGSPLDTEWVEDGHDAYYTHFTPIAVPETP